MEILKKMTHLKRISAAIILASGLWVGLSGECDAWNLSGGSYSGKSKSVTSQASSPKGMAFSSDGTKMYVQDTNKYVYQYTLSTAWDISTASYASKSYNLSNGQYISGIAFANNGSKIYSIANGSSLGIYQYTLSTPWDISTASYDSKTFSYSATCGSAGQDIYVKEDGKKVFIVESGTDKICEYNLGTDYDISSASFVQSLALLDTTTTGVDFNPDGNKFFVDGRDNNLIYQYENSAWNISAATTTASLSVSDECLNGTHSVKMGSTNLMYVLCNSDDTVYQYNISADYTAAEILITYPAASSTSKAEFWTVDANTNDDTTYDKLYVKVRSASTEACADNVACSSAWVDGNKVIGECDGSNSTFDNTSNISRLSQIPDSMDGETIYATAFLYGVTDATCVDGEGPETPVLLATSDTISFTYSIDYITDLSDADEFWAASWEERWGEATSTIMYQAVAGGLDTIMSPVMNWASGWSHLFNTADATDAGISAGSGVQTLAQHAKDFFNVIPGCQLFAILLIAIIIDIAIYIYKNIYRIKKFFTI